MVVLYAPLQNYPELLAFCLCLTNLHPSSSISTNRYAQALNFINSNRHASHAKTSNSLSQANSLPYTMQALTVRIWFLRKLYIYIGPLIFQ